MLLSLYLTISYLQRDVMIYNALDPATLKDMRKHVQRYGTKKGLVRGAQFNTFSQGKMCAFGERTPSGGAPGDCHRHYDVMNATTVDSLHCLFDNAEVGIKCLTPTVKTESAPLPQDSLVFSEIIRVAAPEIHEQIYEVTRQGERVGKDASTLFYCTNYAAPLHFDDDTGPGLCATLEIDADPYEYCFLNLAYPFYFTPRAGSLW